MESIEKKTSAENPKGNCGGILERQPVKIPAGNLQHKSGQKADKIGGRYDQGRTKSQNGVTVRLESSSF